MALTANQGAVKVDPPMGTVTDDLLNLPGEMVVQAQPAGAFTVAVSPDNKPSPVPATAISFTKNAITVAIGKDNQLFVNFDPKYTGDKTLVWSVDDDTIATVDAHGVVHGVKLGDAVVTAKVKSKPTLTIDAAVTVAASFVPALKFTTDLPTTKSAVAGSDVTFAVVATGGKAPYSYKWYFGTTLIDAAINPSAATASLVNHAVASNSAGDYKVEVTDAAGTKITSKVCALTVTVALTGITATPTSLSLSVAADATNGKTVAFTPAPAGASLGTLSIKTQPTAGTATATLSGTTLTVKPVAAGTTSVVVTNGTKDVTVAVTVAA